MLPETPKSFPPPVRLHVPPGSLVATHDLTLTDAFMLDGLLPENVAQKMTMQIVAVRPDGAVLPLLWLYEYSDRYRHAFLLRRPLELPAGTVIRGIRPPARIRLLPVERGARIK
jgi:hypothetical protein